VNHPLAALFDQFLKERRNLKNVTEATLVWYRVAFTNYKSVIAAYTASSLPTKAALQRFVVSFRERAIKPVTMRQVPSSASSRLANVRACEIRRGTTIVQEVVVVKNR
jgi:hypothetical protein